MIPRDTTPLAAAVQEAVQRRLGKVGRLRVALELSDLTHSVAAAGVRRRHPEYSSEEAVEAVARAVYRRTG